VTGTSGLLFAVELVAVLAAAFSGFAESQRKAMDVVGVFTVAFITAFGGGTLRDVLLDRRPFFWVEHESYVILIFALSLVAAPIMRHAHRIIPNAGFIAADAIGLGFFSIVGVSLALEAGPRRPLRPLRRCGCGSPARPSARRSCRRRSCRCGPPS
jgi:uncharacterized membrane protein YeiH